jgi:hypothetical protein
MTDIKFKNIGLITIGLIAVSLLWTTYYYKQEANDSNHAYEVQQYFLIQEQKTVEQLSHKYDSVLMKLKQREKLDSLHYQDDDAIHINRVGTINIQ